MTVSELIEQLGHVPQDAVVTIPYPDNGIGWWPVTGLTFSAPRTGGEVRLFADTDDEERDE